MMNRVLLFCTAGFLFVLGVGTPLAGVITVDAAGGGDYTTIQAGINAAIAGDTINVFAGTYNENLSVIAGKDNLTIRGADKTTTRINVTASYGVSISADGVLFDGFTVKQNAPATVDKALGLMAGSTGNTISNCIFDGTGTTRSSSMGVLVRDSNNIIDAIESFGWTGYGIDVYSGVAGGPHPDNVLIQNSYLHDNRAFNIAVDRSTNVRIEDCLTTGGGFTSAARSSIVFFETALGPVTGGSVTGCTILDSLGSGIWLVGSGVVVDGNEIGNSAVAGVRITTNYWPNYAANNNVVTNNTIHHNAYGVLIDFGTYPEPTGNVFHGNNIHGNTVGFDASALTNWADATGNWWGDASGPSGGAIDPVTGLPASGTGDSVTAGVHWDPFLAASVVADPGGPYRILVGEGLTLDGSGSYVVGATGSIFNYLWSVGALSFDAGSSAVTSFTWPELGQFFGIYGNGVYTLRLTVTDDLGTTAWAETTLTVIPEPATALLIGGALVALVRRRRRSGARAAR